jgi:membrane protein
MNVAAASSSPASIAPRIAPWSLIVRRCQPLLVVLGFGRALVRRADVLELLARALLGRERGGEHVDVTAEHQRLADPFVVAPQSDEQGLSAAFACDLRGVSFVPPADWSCCGLVGACGVCQAARRVVPECPGCGTVRDKATGRRGEAPRDDRRGDVSESRAPGGPAKLRARSWAGVLKRTLTEFKEDKLTVWAAALTYYGILSIFPLLLVLVSVLGLVGQSATKPLIDNVGTLAPGPAKQIVTSAIQNLQQGKGAAGILFIAGLAGALWSASGYIAAFMQASNAIWDVVLLAVMALAVVLTGPIAQQVGNVVGLGSTAVTVWDIAKWPVLILIVSFMFAFLYWASPNVRHPKFRWVSAGGVLAVLLWIVASAAFAFYVANFASYNKTYGSLGGVIIFLVWLWLSNVVILLGAELNAELERARQIEAGRPAEKEPFLAPRDPATS